MAGADTELCSRVVSPRASHRAHGCLQPSRVQGSVTFSLETPGEEEPSHSLLDVCFLCRKPLGASRDIYMYRGDTPFCSEECRQEQMELDEAREREMSFRRRRHQLHQAAHAKQAPPSARQALCKGASDAVVAS